MQLAYFVVFLSVWGSSLQLSDEEILSKFASMETKIQEQENIIQDLTVALESTQPYLLWAMVSLSADPLLSAKRLVLDNEGPVAFTAAIKPYHINHVKNQETLKFETLITDIGGGYDNQSGVFVAPIPGIYLFSCSLLDHSGAHNTPGQVYGSAMIHAELVQNQKVLGRIFAHAETTHRDQGANTVLAHVAQGDRVFVRNVDNVDLSLGGELYSTFSGYLLWQM